MSKRKRYTAEFKAKVTLEAIWGEHIYEGAEAAGECIRELEESCPKLLIPLGDIPCRLRRTSCR
jgi:hypothetical protein